MKPVVVIIEDEVHIQRLLSFMIQKMGFDTEVFSSGPEGLKRVQEGIRPAAVMLDIMMPGMNGLEVLQNLKNDETTKGIPVVMLTAMAQENVVLQGIKLGAIDYIRKPFHPQEVAERLQRHLKVS